MRSACLDDNDDDDEEDYDDSSCCGSLTYLTIMDFSHRY